MAHRFSPGRAAFAVIVLGCVAAIGLGVEAQQGQTTPIDILAQPGCDVGTALVPNMQECVVDQLMGSNGTLTLTFNIGPKSKHSVLLTLRSVGGIAEMRLFDSGEDIIDGSVVYFNDAITESFIRVDADQLTTGQYTLVIQGMGGATQKLLLYLRVQTPAANVRLAAADKAALQSVLTECCAPVSAAAASDPNGPGGNPFCTQFLPGALAAKTADDDLCNIGDFVCDQDGHLQKVDFSKADLDCKKGFPDAFGQLPSLETLMLRFNNFNGDTLDNVAAVLSNSRHLRRLMIGSANLTGTVPCALFSEHQLMTLMMSGNKLEGTLPSCVLEDSNIQELYMSQTTLSGALPDSISTDSKLKVWYSINADPRTGDLAGPGFSGELPSSISNAAALQYVELSTHQFTGGIPALPPNMVMFEVQNNQLDGGIASPLPASLVYMDADNNTLTGPVPDFSQSPQLTLLDLSQNQLTGSIPSSFGGAAQNLVYLDMSRNTLGGNLNDGNQWEKLPQIQYLLLSENNLQGFVPASLAANKQLVALNLGTNLIEGDLTAFAAAIPPAPKVSPQKAGGRRLQSVSTVPSVDASRLIARKLFGGSEDTITPQPLGWQYSIENVKALATHNVGAARRRLQQAAGATPATATPAAATPAPATPTPAPTATRPAAATPALAPAPAAPEPQVVAEAPAPGGATTTTMANPPNGATAGAAASDTVPQEPTAQTTPQDQTGPDSSSSANPQLAPDASAQSATPQQTQAQPSGDQNDIGLMPIPTSSQLQGNSFLYLNLSGNAITGSIPDQMRNLEMFRNPANSSDPFDMYVTNRGGPDRVLDLANNRLYGEFPLFLIDTGDLQSGCSCTTIFNVTDGNFLYCPTKATMAGVKLSRDEINNIQANNYTCLLPKEGPNQPVQLADYLSKPGNWLTAIPSASDVVTEKQMKTREPTHTLADASPNAPSGSGGGGGSGGALAPGAIAGIVIGVVAGVAIIASLGYFVAYKKFYQVHRATSFKRGELPDGPAMGGAGPYPAAAYGAQPGAHTNGIPDSSFDIETPMSAPKP
eukprot:GHUV01000451.1.p1 GENE.GHUV01000451.1~~GHUV01000451.1.p1  ORF type:complete len:1048 (+),score=213.52 GHUV01000451.1:292-3435(+)